MKKSKANKLLPEKFLALYVLVAIAFANYFKLEFFMPGENMGVINLLMPSSIYPGAFLGVIVIILTALVRRDPVGMVSNIWLVVRLFLLLAVATYINFNFKWWAQYMHQGTYDAELQAFDDSFLPWLTNGATLAGNEINILLQKVLPQAKDVYILLFFAMFCGASVVAAVSGKPANFSLVIISITIVLFLGGLLYCLFPAYGPFFSGISHLNNYSEAQKLMLEKTLIYKQTGDYRHVSGFFDSVLGAFPSLHIAHAIVLCQALWLVDRRAVYPFALMAIYIFLYAMISQFHYAVDLVAGIVLALVIFPIQKSIYNALLDTDFKKKQRFYEHASEKAAIKASKNAEK